MERSIPPGEAPRTRDAERLCRELLALLDSGLPTWESDVRDLLVALAPFHDCARRLGLDVASVFDDAATAGPPSIAEAVRAFGRRDDVTPQAFGFAVHEGQDGPQYRRIDPLT
jgi:hypothetical protein